MKIKYVVSENEFLGANIRTIKKEEFDKVEDAIKFHKKQKDGLSSWWDITVEYS